MKQQEALTEVGKRIVPILQEFGIEGVSMAGYIRCDGTQLERFTSGFVANNDASISDGLGQLAVFSAMWAAGPQHHKLPSTDEKG